MAMRRAITIRRKKGKHRRDIRPCASSKPINATHDTLIHFCAPFKVRILGVSSGDGIDGKA
jgi:hypothetical protein